MRLFEEFKEYEQLWESQDASLKEDYEVWVEGEKRMMPEVFDKAVKTVESVLANFDALKDVDAFDDHYHDGEHMQWQSKWNIFEPFDYDIDILERKLDDFIKPYEKDGIEVYVDADFLEDDGFINVCLTMTV